MAQVVAFPKGARDVPPPCRCQPPVPHAGNDKWHRADGGKVSLVVCGVAELRRRTSVDSSVAQQVVDSSVAQQVVDSSVAQQVVTHTESSVAQQVVAARREGSDVNRPIAFFSHMTFNQRTGQKAAVQSRFAGDPAWGVNDPKSVGFGSDRFAAVGPDQMGACATHVAEIACYAPGHKGDFRVLFTVLPVNYNEIDSLANDLPSGGDSVVYIVLAHPGAIVPSNLAVEVRHTDVATALPFVPDSQLKGIWPTMIPIDMDPPAVKRGADELSAVWAKALVAIRASVGAPQGLLDNRLITKIIACHMARFGATAYRLSPEHGQLVPFVTPQAATGALQLVACTAGAVSSNQLHVHAAKKGHVYMTSIAHDVTIDTSQWLRRHCVCIHYGMNPWELVLSIVTQLSDNKTRRDE